MTQLPVVDSPCHPWTGYIDPNGYGREGRCGYVHRRIYEEAYGPLREGPAHLEAVTPGENSRRGVSFWKNKTHCPQGHPYSGDNLILHRSRRYCRECKRQHNRNYRARKAAA